MTQANDDILALAAHPDDAELLAGGTLALAAQRGCRVTIVDLTRGETATRGTPEQRQEEARTAAEILGARERLTLDLGDGDIANTEDNRRVVAGLIRTRRPTLVLTHAAVDRHPDHRCAHELVRDSVFFANVGGFNAAGERWAVTAVAYFLGNTLNPEGRADWVTDVGSTWSVRERALGCYRSQLRRGSSDGRSTYIGSHAYWDHMERRARLWGHWIGATHGEPFLLDRPACAGHPLVELSRVDHV